MSSCLDAVPWSRLADMDSNRPLPPPWVIAGGVVAALVLIFLLGIGFGQQWGARTMGTTGRLGRRSGHLRRGRRGVARGRTRPTSGEVDHEISRRRECIAALGELWGALVGLIIDFRTFVDYLDDLGQNFDPAAASVVSPGPGERQVLKTYGEIIGERIQDFFDKWAKAVEPPLFTVRLVLRGTPLTLRWSRSISISTQSKPMGSSSITKPVLA